ncbi:hypothetical protein GH714_028266 [Hevea brasiliensis]|uniref:FAR1 domain-containing protein n=1 Tax=Hevea brasiliensis TaxID=3981 RepID=A0A6A6MFT8_HEVBR|nr:hypothetical protein GH714_028266 [Hevea brasiliensis]
MEEENNDGVHFVVDIESSLVDMKNTSSQSIHVNNDDRGREVSEIISLPYVEMEFDSLDAVELFYKSFAKEKGEENDKMNVKYSRGDLDEITDIQPTNTLTPFNIGAPHVSQTKSRKKRVCKETTSGRFKSGIEVSMA